MKTNYSLSRKVEAASFQGRCERGGTTSCGDDQHRSHSCQDADVLRTSIQGSRSFAWGSGTSSLKFTLSVRIWLGPFPEKRISFYFMRGGMRRKRGLGFRIIDQERSLTESSHPTLVSNECYWYLCYLFTWQNMYVRVSLVLNSQQRVSRVLDSSIKWTCMYCKAS